MAAPDTQSQEEGDSVNAAANIDGPDYDYLLSMTMWNLTKEKKDELLKKRDDKLAELQSLLSKSQSDLWNEDLDALLQKVLV